MFMQNLDWLEFWKYKSFFYFVIVQWNVDYRLWIVIQYKMKKMKVVLLSGYQSFGFVGLSFVMIVKLELCFGKIQFNFLDKKIKEI